MNDLITDIKSLELETIKNLRNSKSENTIRAYQSDYNEEELSYIKSKISLSTSLCFTP